MTKLNTDKTEFKISGDGTVTVFTSDAQHINRLLNQFGEEAFDEIEYSSEGAVTSIYAENLEGIEFSF